MRGIKLNKIQADEEDKSTEQPLCEECGSVKVLEDGKYICPNCDAQIDYFGEDDEDNT